MMNRSAMVQTSAITSRLQFNEPAAGPAFYFSEPFAGYALEGRVLLNRTQPSVMPHVLAIHGARSDYSKLNGLLYPLQAAGVASLSFNLSGHNTTTDISAEDTSLTRNLEESLRFAGHPGAALDTVIGHSLGGALALKVAEVHRATVRKIILFCPAVYPEAAYAQPFGKPFKRVLSVPYGFLDSSSLAFLRTFAGKVMLVIGEFDGLRSTAFGGIAGKAAGLVQVRNDQQTARGVNSAIPWEVIDAIENSVSPDQLEKLVLPGCDHAISAWLGDHPQHARDLAKKIATFLT
ncbi:alpha/beta hydrolase [Pseudomonas sp. CDFA 602]|nr:alpha/beta hydrolase [Pseudomonas californiensis]MCD5999592.1 alpha/beta hydrolase [Pseudomonas californiensis]